MAADKKKETAPKKKPKAKPAATTEFKTKNFGDYTIKAKRSGRYMVIAKDGKLVNGPDKAKVLIEAKLVKVDAPQKKAEASA